MSLPTHQITHYQGIYQDPTLKPPGPHWSIRSTTLMEHGLFIYLMDKHWEIRRPTLVATIDRAAERFCLGDNSVKLTRLPKEISGNLSAAQEWVEAILVMKGEL